MVGKRLVAFIGIVLFGFLGSALAADYKIAYVDIQKAVNESNAGKDAKKAITKEVEKFQRQITDKQKELQTLKESLEKQAPCYTDARATRRENTRINFRNSRDGKIPKMRSIKTDRVERNISIAYSR
jgi:outer membrane protein